MPERCSAIRNFRIVQNDLPETNLDPPAVRRRIQLLRNALSDTPDIRSLTHLEPRFLPSPIEGKGDRFAVDEVR